MKQFYLSLCIFGVVSTTFAQPCTEPDTSLVRANKVKSVTVYYHPNSSDSFLHHVFEYNSKGQLFRERAGHSELWAEYKYDKQGRIISVANVTEAAGPTTLTETRFMKDGTGIREVVYSTNDDGKGLQIQSVSRYDSLNRRIYYAWYSDGKPNRVQFFFPTNSKGPILMRDSSIANHEVFVCSGMQVIKWTRYSNSWKIISTSEFVYSEPTNGLNQEIVIDSAGRHKYVPKYNDEGQLYELTLDGKKLNSNELQQWQRTRHFIKPPEMPREKNWGDDIMDYGLEVPELVESRSPVYGKNGLLIEEILMLSVGSPNSVKFSYRYEYHSH